MVSGGWRFFKKVVWNIDQKHKISEDWEEGIPPVVGTTVPTIGNGVLLH
jgi:hypothetical protein